MTRFLIGKGGIAVTILREGVEWRISFRRGGQLVRESYVPGSKADAMREVRASLEELAVPA